MILIWPASVRTGFKTASVAPILSWVFLMLSACFLTGCGDPKSREDIVGTYAASVPSDGKFVRNYTVELNADGSCRLAREYVREGKSRVAQENGSWTNSAAKVTIIVKGTQTRKKTTNSVSEVFSFNWNSGKLVCTEWDREAYGDEGLGTLTKTNLVGSVPGK